MRQLTTPVRADSVPSLTAEDLRVLAASPRDPLQGFLIDHAVHALQMPNALLLWFEHDALRGWCRPCGDARELDWGGDGPAPLSVPWWQVIAVALVGQHRGHFTTADGMVTPAYHDAIARLEDAVGRCVLLELAGADGRSH